MAWQFLITDLNGNVHGEIGEGSDRKVGLQHMRIPSASFTMPLDHYLANTVMDTDCLLRCYRFDEITGVKPLVFNGPVISAEEASSEGGGGVGVVAAGPFWRCTKRFIGLSAAGYAEGSPIPVDLGLAAHNILDATNGLGFTGIGKGSRSAVTTGAFGPWHIKPVAEGIAELHAGVNSFEFVVDPVEPQSEPGGVGGWPRLGNMRIAPIIGSTLPDQIFEYGTDRANVNNYTRSKTREGMITQGIMNITGFPETPFEGRGLLITDADTIAARGLLQDLIPDVSITDLGLRQSLMDFHLRYRKNPREIVTFQPAVNARPSPVTDYMPGDTIRGRAVVDGTVRFDAMFRIWGASFSIDQAGNENVEVELLRP